MPDSGGVCVRVYVCLVSDFYATIIMTTLHSPAAAHERFHFLEHVVHSVKLCLLLLI